MTMKACSECKKEISTEANPCPLCGKKNPHGSSKIVLFGGTIVAMAGAFWLLGGGAQREVESQAADELVRWERSWAPRGALAASGSLYVGPLTPRKALRPLAGAAAVE